MSAWLNGIVVAQHHWNDKLHSLLIEAPIEPWQAGQFIKIGLDIDGEIVGRPYSLLNPPPRQPIEIYYIHVPQGVLTSRLIELGPGDGILVSPRANGFMVLDEIPPAQTLWLMATGTGVGPFLAFLDDDRLWQRYAHGVRVYAARTLDELGYRERIAAESSAHAGQFVFIPVISREPSDFALPGRIPQAIESGVLERRAGVPLDPATAQVVLCGNPAMVEDTMLTLVGRGMKKHRRRDPGQITTESYW